MASSTTKRPLCSQTVLDQFWSLAEGGSDTRAKSTAALVNGVQAGGDRDLKYALQRLVRGFFSGRKMALIGFPQALTQLLRAFPQVQASEVLALMWKHLQVTKLQSKLEAGQMMLGRVLGYMCLLQSGCMLKDKTGKSVKAAVEDLLTIQSEKSYLQQVCSQALLDIISKVDTGVFEKQVWPLLSREVSKGWEDCSPDRLALLISCLQHHKTVVDKNYLKTHWKTKLLFSKKMFDEIFTVFQRCTNYLPTVHIVVDAFIQGLDSGDLVDFWSCVGGKLMDQTLQRKQIALHIWTKILPGVETAEQMATVLTPALTLCFMRSLGSADKPLYTACHQAMDALCERTAKLDTAVQLQVFKALVQTPGAPSLDTITKSSKLSRLVSSFSKESIQQLTKDLFSFIEGADTFSFGDRDRQECEKWAVSRLVQLLVVDRDPDLQLSTLQFLLRHAFFSLAKPCKALPHCKVKVELAQEVKTHCQGCLTKALDSLNTFHPENMTKAQKYKAHISLVSGLVKYAEDLRQHGVTQEKPFSQEAEAQWKKCMAVLESEKSAADALSEHDAFQMLFLYLALQLFSEPGSATDILMDLHVCYQKNKKRSKKQTEEPEWVCVVTEVLLSLMSRPSRLARHLATTVLQMLLPHLTCSALAIITQTLQSNQDDEEQLGFEDEDEELAMEEDEEEGDAPNADEAEEEEAEEEEETSESSEDSDEDEEDEEMEMDESQRQTIKEALGAAAVNSDDEDDDVPDLSDSEMCKLDDKLAAAFRSLKKGRKKEQKERENQVKDFKIKVLDLIKTVVQGSPKADIVVDLLEPLLAVVMEGERNKEHKALGNKAMEIFRTLVKQRKIPGEASMDGASFVVVLQNLIQQARTAPNVNATKQVSDACILVMRLAQEWSSLTSGEPSPATTRSGQAKQQAKQASDTKLQMSGVIFEALSNVLHKRDSQLHISFFQNLLSRCPVQLWSGAGQLVQVLKDSQAKVYSKTQACSALAALVRQDVVQKLEADEWKEFSADLGSVLEQMVLEMSPKTVKPKLAEELLLLLHHFLQVCQACPGNCQMDRARVREQLEQLKSGFSTDVRRACNKALTLLRKRR